MTRVGTVNGVKKVPFSSVFVHYIVQYCTAFAQTTVLLKMFLKSVQTFQTLSSAREDECARFAVIPTWKTTFFRRQSGLHLLGEDGKDRLAGLAGLSLPKP